MRIQQSSRRRKFEEPFPIALPGTINPHMEESCLHTTAIVQRAGKGDLGLEAQCNPCGTNKGALVEEVLSIRGTSVEEQNVPGRLEFEEVNSL